MTFDGIPLFGNGPLRTIREPIGEQLTPRAALGIPGGGLVAAGPLDFAITFTGRLITDTPAQLQELIESITGAFVSPPGKGELVDEQGNAWSAISFVRFEPLGPFERGRVCSLAFKAKFVNLRE